MHSGACSHAEGFSDEEGGKGPGGRAAIQRIQATISCVDSSAESFSLKNLQMESRVGGMPDKATKSHTRESKRRSNLHKASSSTAQPTLGRTILQGENKERDLLGGSALSSSQK